MSSDHPRSSGPFVEAPARRGTGVLHVLLIVVCVAIATRDGTSGIGDAFANLDDGSSWPTIGALVVGTILLLGLLRRAAGRWTPTRQRRGRRVLRVLLPTLVTTALAVGANTYFQNQRTDADPPPAPIPSVDWPLSSTSSDQRGDGCPEPAAGRMRLDSATTDCLAPLTASDVFPAPGQVSIQGSDYRSVLSDDTDSCGSVASTPADAQALAASNCARVIRGVYETGDGSARVDAAVLEFGTLEIADSFLERVERGTSPVVPLTGTARGTDPDAEARGVCLRAVGRYVTCVRAPSTDAGRTIVRDIAYLVIDVLVARQIAGA